MAIRLWFLIGFIAAPFCLPAPTCQASDGLVFSMPANLEAEEVKRLSGKITEGVLGLKRDAAANQRERLVVVVDFNPEGLPCRQADWEACLKLSRVLLSLDPSDVLTVGHIRGEVSRFAVLPAFSCEELVFSRQGFLGAVSDTADELDANDRARFEETARRRSRPPVIARRLIDKGTVVVRDPAAKAGEDPFRDGRVFAGGEKVIEADIAGAIDQEMALKLGLCVPEPIDTAEALLARYHLPRDLVQRTSHGGESLLGAAQIQLLGQLSGGLAEKLSRDLRRAEAMRPGLVVVNLEAHGVDVAGAIDLANLLVRSRSGDIDDIKPLKLVGYLGPQARDLALLPALACGQIAAHDKVDISFEDFLSQNADQRESLVTHLKSLLVEQRWFDAAQADALSRALTDPQSELLLARPPGGMPRLVSGEGLERGWKADRILKPKGTWLRLPASLLRDPLRLASPGGATLEIWYAEQGIPVGEVRVLGNSGIDELAYFLGHRGTTMFLVTIGLACLMIEILKPGLAFPGIISAVCFVLVFWANSRISGQVDWLAILLFILGILLLLVEIFLIPGFGVVGLSGLALMAGGLGLAVYGHYPQTGGEWIGFGRVLAPFGFCLLGAIGLVAAFMRNLRHIPFAKHLLLHGNKLAEDDSDGSAIVNQDLYLALLGKQGQTTTPLRPAGKALIDGDPVDVVSDGRYVEVGTPVVVIQVEGNRVVVRAV
ncbi:MAG: hypothetical protein NTV55_07840 [Planctomycetota bacterium]|nr:hypothetical protein [Planctomycetota bacterium]